MNQPARRSASAALARADSARACALVEIDDWVEALADLAELLHSGRPLRGAALAALVEDLARTERQPGRLEG